MDQYCRVSFKDYPWSYPIDIYDYYDLRYLFDDDEILESKRRLIEDLEKNFGYENEEDEDFNAEGLEPDVAIVEDNMEFEVWIEDENWDMRFIPGEGFVHDGYDSGYDEPYKRRQEYSK